MPIRTILHVLLIAVVAIECCDIAALGHPTPQRACCCSMMEGSTCTCSDQPDQGCSGVCSFSRAGCTPAATLMVAVEKEPALPIVSECSPAVSFLTLLPYTHSQVPPQGIHEDVFHPPNFWYHSS